MRRLYKGLLGVFAVAVLTLAGASLPGMEGVKVVQAASDSYTVSVSSGYLALRTAPSYDASNEIGKLYNGDTVTVQDYTSGGYWWVYAPSLGKSGYVNNDYLVAKGSSSTSYGTYKVKVSTGYLALRTSPYYDASNEIGELYTGDTVEVKDKSGQYWWVYSSKLGKSGYVNSDYLVSGSSSSSSSSSYGTYTVKVSKGYLALRTKPTYDASNEIGELYTGDKVEVKEKGGQYWWVYSPKLGKSGYVNSDYLVTGSSSSSSSYGTYTVKVSKGYLALRTKPAYDESNEIGELYTGDTVEVIDKSGSKYWWVYSPKLDKSGYVNKDYLVSGGSSKSSSSSSSSKTSGNTYRVTLDVGYLSLRSTPEYSKTNEKGKLYDGDLLEVQNKDDSTYWYVYSSSLGYGYVNKKYLQKVS